MTRNPLPEAEYVAEKALRAQVYVDALPKVLDIAGLHWQLLDGGRRVTIITAQGKWLDYWPATGTWCVRNVDVTPGGHPVHDWRKGGLRSILHHLKAPHSARVALYNALDAARAAGVTKI